MSSYVTFWVKNKKGAVTRLCDFCRSSFIYQAAKEVGIEGKYDEQTDKSIWDRDKWAEPYTQAIATELASALQEKIKTWKESRDANKEKIKLIKDMANASVGERLEAISEYEATITEYEGDLEQLEVAAAQVAFLEHIRDAVASYNSTKEEKDNCLWAGIDCEMIGEPNEEE